MRRWHIRDKGRFLIVTKIGVDMKRYPAVMKHLKQWQPELEKRQDQGEHWWELRSCAYYEAFDKPKIVFPDISMEPRFAYSPYSLFLGNTGYIIDTDDLFLLSCLNSSVMWRYIEDTFQCLGDPMKSGRFRCIFQSMITLPIPCASKEQKAEIAALAQKCLDAKGQIAHFIEDVYQLKRIHSSLGFLTPSEFEAQCPKDNIN